MTTLGKCTAFFLLAAALVPACSGNEESDDESGSKGGTGQTGGIAGAAGTAGTGTGGRTGGTGGTGGTGKSGTGGDEATGGAGGEPGPTGGKSGAGGAAGGGEGGSGEEGGEGGNGKGGSGGSGGSGTAGGGNGGAGGVAGGGNAGLGGSAGGGMAGGGMAGGGMAGGGMAGGGMAGGGAGGVAGGGNAGVGGIAGGGMAGGGMAGGGMAGAGGGQIGCGSLTLIDDMEDGDSAICPGFGRQGGWYNAKESGVGTIIPDVGVVITPSTLIPARGTSARGVHFQGSGFPATGHWALVGISIHATGGAPYNASVHQGMTFWAKSDQGVVNLNIKFPTVASTDSNFGGSCVPTTVACGDHWQASRQITGAWQQFTIYFPTNLSQLGWGVPVPKDLAHLLDVEFLFQSTASQTSFDFWIDDVEFY